MFIKRAFCTAVFPSLTDLREIELGQSLHSSCPYTNSSSTSSASSWSSIEGIVRAADSSSATTPAHFRSTLSKSSLAHYAQKHSCHTWANLFMVILRTLCFLSLMRSISAVHSFSGTLRAIRLFTTISHSYSTTPSLIRGSWSVSSTVRCSQISLKTAESSLVCLSILTPVLIAIRRTSMFLS